MSRISDAWKNSENIQAGSARLEIQTAEVEKLSMGKHADCKTSARKVGQRFYWRPAARF
jgi:hypothetical protein